MAAQMSCPGVLEMLRAFRNGSLRPQEQFSICHHLANLYEPWLQAFAHLPDGSRTSFPEGPLGGVPIGVKDIIATIDMPTANGSPLFQGHFPEQDAAVVQRLRMHGGIVFGKTVTTEFAWRFAGPTVNPFHHGHTPGGSSSGSAAAVAAGIVPLALGTQTVGSIIRPAAFCGVVGLKPSFGTISLNGVHPFAPSLDHLGLFTRSVDDAAYALSLLARSPPSAGTPVPTNHAILPPFEVDIGTGLPPCPPPRLLLVRTSRWNSVGREQQAVLERSAQVFAAAGAIVEQGNLPAAFEDVWRLIHVVLATEAATGFGRIVDDFPDRSSAPLQQIVAEGRNLLPADYDEARAAQLELRAVFETALQGFDALLMVPAPGEAPVGLADTGDATFCAPWSFTGVPAITLPAGWSRNGLPLGLQFVGPWHRDLALLQVAKWAERTLKFQGRPIIQ